MLGVVASLVAVAALRLESSVPLHDPATSSWVRLERADPSERVTLTVALKVEDDALNRLEAVFWAVSTPGHEDYGKHLTNKEITALLNVADERVSIVADHFRAVGSEVIVAPNRDMLTVTMPASVAEEVLSTKLHWFKHSRASDAPRILRSVSGYSLHESVAPHVLLVGELLQFPHVREPMLIAPEQTKDPLLGATRSSLGELGLAHDTTWPGGCDALACSTYVTPTVLAARYKLPSATDPLMRKTGAANGNSMAVAEFQGQYYKLDDIAKFGVSCHVSDVSINKTIGGDLPVAGVESELDIEYIKAVAPSVPLTVVYNSAYSLIGWTKQISSLDDPPLVHSVSYGNDEAQQSSEEFMATANNAFMKAGARGLSILFASGDQGVCGREGCSPFGRKFHPDFPAGSPYITAVGGTDFAVRSVVGEEKAWTASGGGFSDTFDAPAYQKDAVAAYLASPDADLPPKSMWTPSGRGYPDVSALGGQVNPYCVASSGRFAGVAGTSASCPVVAGVFAMLNGLRLDAGKPPLGFLNPFIYQNPQGFQDVVLGLNSGSTFGKYGFKAVKGWDAATGFGTPDFEALKEAI